MQLYNKFLHKMNKSYVHHFNYCQLRIRRGAGKYLKRKFINAVHTTLNLDYWIAT